MVHPTPPNLPTPPTQTTILRCQTSEKLGHHNQKPPLSPPISPDVTSDNYNSLMLLDYSIDILHGTFTPYYVHYSVCAQRY
jgi:hypothetical protein